MGTISKRVDMVVQFRIFCKSSILILPMFNFYFVFVWNVTHLLPTPDKIVIMLTLYRLEECLRIIYTDDGNCENFSCFWCFAYFFNKELKDQKQSLEMCIASLFFGWITLGLNRCPFEYCNPSLFPAIFDSNCPELTIQIYPPYLRAMFTCRCPVFG